MRFYDVVLFIFLFNISLSLISGLNLFNTQPVQANQEYIDTYDPSLDDRFTYDLDKPPVDTGTQQDINFGDFFAGMQIFLSAFSYATVGVLPMMLQIFPSAPILASVLSIMIYFIYGIGIVQFVLNRPLKVMQ